MKAASRIAKLRRMAEHPTSNPHEATIAREEMERLLKAHPEARENSWRHVGRSKSVEEFASRYADMLKHDDCHCRLCGIRLYEGWVASISWNRCPAHLKIVMSGDAGYAAWARSLKVGDRVTVVHSVSPLIGTQRDKYQATISGVTATQYVTDDLTRFRRTGRYPGHKVGENGRDGRTYLVAICKHDGSAHSCYCPEGIARRVLRGEQGEP